MIIVDILIVIAAYLVGSIPTAYVVVKLRLGKDIRDIGSGNVGSTNAMRTVGFFPGVLVFAGDVFKGFITTFAGLTIGGPWLAVAAGAAAFIGHLYPMWLGFRGGKGVATGLGMSLALTPLLGLIAFALWGVLALSTGYVSIGSCSAALGLALLCLFTSQPWPYTLLFFFMAALVVLRHRTNIERLCKGEESKSFRRK